MPFSRAIVLMIQAFREDLKRNPGSAIVAISSINAMFGNGSIPIYSAAKGAVLSLVRSMADELSLDGIRINALSPGMIDTPILGDAREAMRSIYPPRHLPWPLWHAGGNWTRHTLPPV